MFNTTVDIILIMFQIFVVQAAGEYYESNYTSTWEDAGKKCKIATPAIRLTQKGYIVDIDHKLSHSEAWIGYFSMMTVFEYIGCMKIDEQHSKQTFTLTRQHNSPGLCYKTCNGKELIGISIDKCICLDTIENYLEPSCQMRCRGSNEGLACGGEDFMSVYKVLKNESARYSSGRSECLLYYNYGFIWSDCHEGAIVWCENEEGAVSFDIYQQWKQSVAKCIREGSRPASYATVRRIHQFTFPTWSGVISSDVIYNYKEMDSSYTDIRFGYMTADRNVHFIHTHVKKYVLCKRAATPLSTIPSTAAADTSGTTGNDVTVIVGVSASVVLVVAAVVTTFVFVRKRQKTLGLCNSMAKTTNETDTGHGSSINDEVVLPSYENVAHITDTKQSNGEEYCGLDEFNSENDVHTYSTVQRSNCENETYVNTDH